MATAAPAFHHPPTLSLPRVAVPTTLSGAELTSRYLVTTEKGKESGNSERAAVRAELDGLIAQALDKLSPKLRAAIVLTALHHCSPNEVAQIEGCSTGTVYWRIHEAREQLQGQLAAWLKT